VVCDPETDGRHHTIGEESGKINDVPWDAAGIRNAPTPGGLEAREYQVVLRDRRTLR